MLVSLVCSLYAGDDLKTNYRTALVMAYSPTNSIFEDDNLKLQIYDENLYATNKTNKTIFIDLSQCFLMHNGSSYPMFNSQHQDEKKASKKNVSSSIDEFISIAPSTGTRQNETFICNFSAGVGGKYTTTESPSGEFTDYEERLLDLIGEMVNESIKVDPKGKQYLGTSYRHLLEDESVNNIGASIAYAFNKRAEEWTPVTISTWVSDLYFAPYYVEMPEDIKKKDQKGFGVKKTDAAKIHIKADSPFEFDQDRCPIAVWDWTGDFKKGTFELNSTRISKKKGISLGTALLGGLATLATGGVGAVFLTNPEETTYKSVINFNGENSEWGKMSYLNNKDLSQFNNKRK